MKGWLLTIGLIFLIAVEILRVYFIMPFPGSQESNTISIAYFIDRNIWWLRAIGFLIVIIPLTHFLRNGRIWKKIVLILVLLFYGIVTYAFNFKFLADKMFYQPQHKNLLPVAENKVDTNKLVIAVAMNGEAKAYPIEIIGYHHQVQDTIAGEPIMVTYCTVCRTGRVFEPIVNGKKEKFRLVGMDHFNAMLEDATTKSWWRQVTGEAIAGKLKGLQLPEVYSTQTSLADWLQLNPNSLIMQADENFIKSYDSTFKYESGASKSKLTGTDSLSWKDKSWVIGVKAGKERKAYDWNQLKKEKLIQDKIGATPILIVLSKNEKSFFAFERPAENSIFNLNGDTLLLDNHKYRIDGKGIDTSFSLKPLPASQEFWHSWRTFNPGTLH